MRTFKKILLSAFAFILILTVLSCVILIPWKNSESAFYMDAKLRKNLAGKIDFIVIGASHGLFAFIPEIIDKELGSFSYNLSSILMPMYNRTYMLEKEIKRNPVKTVVLEVSFNALTETHEREFGEGSSVNLLRLDSFFEKIAYFVKYIDFNDWLNIYCRDMQSALSYWKTVLQHNETHIDYSAKGYSPQPSFDITLDPTQIIDKHNSSKAIGEYIEENINQFNKMIKICKENKAEIYVVCTPISDAKLWQSDDWDSFSETMKKMCAENDVPWIDFNLYKNRYVELTDSVSFRDDIHLSQNGAKKFTYMFTDIISLLRKGDDISSYFYDSYAAMKEDSPYMEVYSHSE